MYLPTTYILTYLLTYFYIYTPSILLSVAFLAQSVERAALNRTVVGSSPTGSVFSFLTPFPTMRLFSSPHHCSFPSSVGRACGF